MNTDTHDPDAVAASPARFYTLAEAASILRVNPSTLSRQCASGTFPHVRVGRTVRIPVAEVDRLERGEPMRESVLDVPDYVTDTPSMFDAADLPTRSPAAPVTVTEAASERVPEADSPEDDADMLERGL